MNRPAGRSIVPARALIHHTDVCFKYSAFRNTCAVQTVRRPTPADQCVFSHLAKEASQRRREVIDEGRCCRVGAHAVRRAHLSFLPPQNSRCPKQRQTPPRPPRCRTTALHATPRAHVESSRTEPAPGKGCRATASDSVTTDRLAPPASSLAGVSLLRARAFCHRQVAAARSTPAHPPRRAAPQLRGQARPLGGAFRRPARRT